MSVNCYFNVTNLSRHRYLQLLEKQREIYEETDEFPPLDSLFEENEKGIDGEDVFIDTIDTVTCDESSFYKTVLDNTFGFDERIALYFGDRYTWEDFEDTWDYDVLQDVCGIEFFLPKEDLDYALSEIEDDYLCDLNSSDPVSSDDLEESEFFYDEAVGFYNALRRLKQLKKEGKNVTFAIGA